MLWLGDNWYYLGPDLKNTSLKIKEALHRGDWSDTALMRKRALIARNNANLAPLLGAVPHVAVWDDHDFGHNNAPYDGGRIKPEELKGHWVGREKAREVFASMWANPPQTGGGRGVQFAFRRGPAAFFMMDDRYHKDPGSGRIWGQEQLTWLAEALQRADLEGAAVKFIANGTQVIAPTGPESHTAEGKDEIKQLREFVRSQKIRNVVFLSGDRHRCEFWTEPGEPALHEFTASPFQHSLVRVDGNIYSNRVWIAPPAPAFGLITVDVPERGAGTVRMEVRNASNAVPACIAQSITPVGGPCAAVLDLKTGTLAK
jgi:alkaline phosphatase D